MYLYSQILLKMLFRIFLKLYTSFPQDFFTSFAKLLQNIDDILPENSSIGSETLIAVNFTQYLRNFFLT